VPADLCYGEFLNGFMVILRLFEAGVEICAFYDAEFGDYRAKSLNLLNLEIVSISVGSGSFNYYLVISAKAQIAARRKVLQLLSASQHFYPSQGRFCHNGSRFQNLSIMSSGET
jgi:hypothetical protein